MTRSTYLLATRKSALALAQSRAFARDLSAATGAEIGELQVVTTGDRITDVPLSQVGGKGLFTKEIEQALAEGRADLAVHSSKDVPAEIDETFVLACFPRRADPRDVLVTRDGATLATLPKGARLGTSSLRRALMLGAARPDLVVAPLRGNVDTRLRKLEAGEVDAIVLARAGLDRLGLGHRATETIDAAISLPAAGQGALAVECRADDADTRALLSRLDDADTRIAVACERGVMRRVGGGCTLPFAAHAVREGESIWLRAFLAEADGTKPRSVERRAAWPQTEADAARLGSDAGEALLAG